MSADLTVPPPWPSADGNLLRPGKPVAAIYTGDRIRARDEEWQERIASLRDDLQHSEERGDEWKASFEQISKKMAALSARLEAAERDAAQWRYWRPWLERRVDLSKYWPMADAASQEGKG